MGNKAKKRTPPSRGPAPIVPGLRELHVFDYVRPLVAAMKGEGNFFPTSRFVGTCFFVDQTGTAATCAHIIERLVPGEALFSIDNKTRAYVPVRILATHQTADIALIKLPVSSKNFELRHDRVLLGRNGMSYGFLNGGVHQNTLVIDYRVMKGHISRVVSRTSSSDRSHQFMEMSYPSLAGFSGAPVIDEHSLSLLGMLYGNVESSVEVFSFVDIERDGSRLKESVNRLVELGKAHTVDTVVRCLQEIRAAKSVA